MAKSKIPTVKQVRAEVLKRFKIPYIFVEGIDDIKFYENMADSIGKKCKIKPIDHFTNYSCQGNCNKVILYMEELSKILNNNERDYFLGIIDGDARKYRDDIEEIEPNDLLYILKYYSWESYFVNNETVKLSIKKYLKTNQTDEVADYIYQQVDFNPLWLCGLERLKDNYICKSDYPLKNPKNINQLKDLEEELFKFAIERNITIDNLLETVKGKWALKYFVQEYLKILKNLSNLCKKRKIEICDYCKIGDNQNCLYKLKAKYREDIIEADITELTDLISLDEIKERLLKLGYKKCD